MQYIPSIEVPVLKGKYGEIKYRISGIDLSGFRLKSSDGTPLLSVFYVCSAGPIHSEPRKAGRSQVACGRAQSQAEDQEDQVQDR